MLRKPAALGPGSIWETGQLYQTFSMAALLQVKGDSKHFTAGERLGSDVTKGKQMKTDVLKKAADSTNPGRT